MEPTKQCSKCHAVKSVGEFYKSKQGEYGVMAECKACNKARAHADQQRAKIAVEAKECTRCHEVKPATEFGKYQRSSDGLASACKTCHGLYYVTALHKEKVIVEHKECSQCHLVKSSDDFYTNPASKDGLHAECKCCRNARNEAWAEANPEKHKAIANGYFKRAYQDPEKRTIFHEHVQEWRKENPDKIQEHRERDIEKNGDNPKRKEGRRKANKKWFEDHPTYKRAASHKRRALLKNATVIDTLIDIDILYKRDKGICSLCGQPINNRLKWPDLMCKTIDHILPLTKGGTHSWANVALAHHHCNTKKNNGIATQQMRLF